MRFRVSFDGRRANIPGGKVFLGVSGDNLVEEIAFRTPEYAGALAFLKLRYGRNEYKLALSWDAAEGVWVIPVTREMLAMLPRIEAQLQLEAPADGGDVIVWQSLIFPVYVEATIDADGAIEAQQAPYLQLLEARLVAALDLVDELTARVGALEAELSMGA